MSRRARPMTVRRPTPARRWWWVPFPYLFAGLTFGVAPALVFGLLLIFPPSGQPVQGVDSRRPPGCAELAARERYEQSRGAPALSTPPAPPPHCWPPCDVPEQLSGVILC